MPIQDTSEEYKAKKINSRNFSDILPVIAFLKRREDEEYAPSAFSKILYRFEAVGENQANSQSTFNGTRDPANPANAKTVFAKGDEILLTGTATYRYMKGTVVLEIRPATTIVAQIDIGRTDSSFSGKQVYMSAGEINLNGNFSFKIPSSMTSEFASGSHTIYLDAESPDNRPVRLRLAAGVSGTGNNVASFTII